MNEVEQCTCRGYPYYLIQIDRLLAPIIRVLNRKGYQTSACCAGHPGFRGDNASAEQLVYVAFRETFDFSVPFPAGSKYRKDGKMICYDIPEEGKEWDVEKLKEYQRESIRRLLEWADELPVYGYK